ncbi:ABC transporter substrate-binding protein [Comamonas sp. CAH-2]|uniref:ABC transporter substrate-binding protein n=1 Tax=Comamonas sp. CAH-2 TaxID=2605745 RepID=UPI0012ADC984|nr:ABC transporter substrate-binding protein [Comamonas sp. CAH-2]MRT21272.1 ABC transporter substrate-binding protein [Comamonas sp. CAH-2]
MTPARRRFPLAPFALAAAALCLAAGSASLAAAAAETIKVGVALDISGPFAGPGAEIRDGLNLAAKQLGNKLGGLPAEFLQADTAGNPETARQVADRFLKRDKVDFFTGPVGSNVVLAVGPSVFGAKVPFLSANPGPSQLAGAQCNPFFFGTSYQNDAMHEAAGQHAANKGYKKVVVLAPNYPAGKDAVNGFKRAYKQPVADEVYTKVGQLDFAAELAQLRATKPDAVYIFQPGGMGINFIKQFMGAGLNKDIVLISSPFTADEDIIAAVGEPMVGIYNASSYAHDLDNATNKQFVAEFQKAYGRLPTLYAAFAYDVVMNIDAAVKSLNGKLDDRAAVAKAVKTAKFNSVRGPVSYGNNQFLVQDYYLRQVVKTKDGKITNALQPGKLFTAHQDSYASQCGMK